MLHIIWIWAKRIAVIVSVLLIVLLVLYVVSRLSDKTMWAVLKVLAVPITVGAAVPWLNWLQKKREHEVENQRAQDEALQAYFDQMSKLLIENRNPAGGELDNASKAVARALTLTVLDTLDSGEGGRHKRRVLRFLYEADLIGKKEDGEEDLTAVVDLSRASLVDADLHGANLRGVNLSGADLGHTNLKETDLSGADLTDARKRVNKKKTVPLDLLPDKELAQKGPTLDGATMPGGQKYEEWKETTEGKM